MSDKQEAGSAEGATGNQQQTKPPWTLGVREIDDVLPGGGLDSAGLHEILPSCYGDSWSALGFALALIARRNMARGAPRSLLWGITEQAAHEFGIPYGPGLARYGIDPSTLLIVRVRRMSDLAWTLEEGLKSRALGAVLGHGAALPAKLGRRLSLAARTHRTPCLLVGAHDGSGLGPALTRWRVSAAESTAPTFDTKAPGPPRWHISLERCRHGPQGRAWTVEWDRQAIRLEAQQWNEMAAANERS